MMKKYKGRCHCGSVTFEVFTNIENSVICDCSICRRRGTTMVRCDERDLVILSGSDVLSMYQFNTFVAEHYFCKICGIYTFHKMRKLPDKFGVNAGCLEEVDPTKLNPRSIYSRTTSLAI